MSDFDCIIDCAAIVTGPPVAFVFAEGVATSSAESPDVSRRLSPFAEAAEARVAIMNARLSALEVEAQPE
jgi:hypothetical protein